MADRRIEKGSLVARPIVVEAGPICPAPVQNRPAQTGDDGFPWAHGSLPESLDQKLCGTPAFPADKSDLSQTEPFFRAELVARSKASRRREIAPEFRNAVQACAAAADISQA